jgi:hypothetical protein
LRTFPVLARTNKGALVDGGQKMLLLIAGKKGKEASKATAAPGPRQKKAG